MALAYAFAPEGIILAFGKHCVGIDTVQGKHSRIPADGNDRDMAAFTCRRVHIGKMLRDPCMRVKAVNDIKELCVLRSLFRQVGCRTAAEEQDINLVRPCICLICRNNGHIFGLDRHRCRIASRKDRHQLHIRRVFDRAFDAATQIAIAHNTDSSHFVSPFCLLACHTIDCAQFLLGYHIIAVPVNHFLRGYENFKNLLLLKAS